MIQRVKDATNDSIRIAFDAISTEETLTFTLKMLAPGEARVMTVLEDIYEIHSPRPGVDMLGNVLFELVQRLLLTCFDSHHGLHYCRS